MSACGGGCRGFAVRAVDGGCGVGFAVRLRCWVLGGYGGGFVVRLSGVAYGGGCRAFRRDGLGGDCDYFVRGYW